MSEEDQVSKVIWKDILVVVSASVLTGVVTTMALRWVTT